MMSLYKKGAAIGTSIVVFFTTSYARAADNLGGAGNLLQRAGNRAYGVSAAPENLAGRVGQLIGIALSLFGTIFFVLMIYGGWKWMMARGDATESKKAKEILTDAVIGLIIVMAAYLVSNFVVDKIGGAVNPTGPMTP